MCHGPWNLITAGVIEGMRVASWPSLRDDLTNAGALWVNDAPVRDRWLLTCRDPGDLDAFNAALAQHVAAPVGETP